MLLIRSTLFFIVMVVTAILIAPLAILTYPFKFPTRYRLISQWARFNIWWLGVTCNLRHEVEGAEHLPRETAIVFAKHQSAWETLALQVICPPQTWVLKRELLRVPFFGWGLAMLEPVAIDRASGRKALQQLITQGKARLESGHWIIIFPEGTRMPPGQRRRFGYGAAKLAEKSGHVVVPIAHNAGDYWRRRSFVKYPGVIKVKIGPPIETKGRKAAEINEEAEAWIANAMTEITGVVEEVVERKKR
ncbi:MAG TPA: 1-acyl-sn-glycerol-3-phosphate acyltransferase [Candidatus Tenderia sp.]|nr:1-acyl-sn-glycerol-3-phosphate acyltransferase [Candidatus Tenderia sp.]